MFFYYLIVHIFFCSIFFISLYPFQNRGASITPSARKGIHSHEGDPISGEVMGRYGLVQTTAGSSPREVVGRDVVDNVMRLVLKYISYLYTNLYCLVESILIDIISSHSAVIATPSWSCHDLHWQTWKSKQAAQVCSESALGSLFPPDNGTSFISMT